MHLPGPKPMGLLHFRDSAIFGARDPSSSPRFRGRSFPKKPDSAHAPNLSAGALFDTQGHSLAVLQSRPSPDPAARGPGSRLHAPDPHSARRDSTGPGRQGSARM